MRAVRTPLSDEVMVRPWAVARVSRSGTRLYSARKAADYERRRDALRQQRWLPVDQRVTDRSLEVQRLLAAKGQHGTAHPVGGCAAGPLSAERYQPRSTHSCRWGDSAPMVVLSPWPVCTIVSSGSDSRRSRMLRRMVGSSL